MISCDFSLVLLYEVFFSPLVCGLISVDLGLSVCISAVYSMSATFRAEDFLKETGYDLVPDEDMQLLYQLSEGSKSSRSLRDMQSAEFCTLCVEALHDKGPSLVVADEAEEGNFFSSPSYRALFRQAVVHLLH